LGNDVFLLLKSFIIFLPHRLPPFLPPLKTEEEEAHRKLETLLALTLILMTRAFSLSLSLFVVQE